MNYCKLFTVYYGLLRFITMYLRQNSTICYELSQITTSNLQGFYELVTDCHRSFYVLVMTCLRVVMNSYELVMSIYKSLQFFAKKYITANLSVSSFDNKSYKKLLRVIYRFLRAVYGWLRVLVSGLRYLTDCYELCTEKSIRGQSSEDF